MLYLIQSFSHSVIQSFSHSVIQGLRPLLTQHPLILKLWHSISTVMPAKAGISSHTDKIPASAGMTTFVKAPWVSNPPRGFSLAEVLVVGLVGSVVLAGSLQALSVSVQSSQVISSSLAERDLKKTVGKIISSPNYCKTNFQPKDGSTGKLEGTDNKNFGIGTITTLESGCSLYFFKR